ncbi:MAG: hypothetical protein U9P70_05455 [Patescibacteria group bacterium]|nr:hypothetical protein [Patescibacteria group bacterium]
MNRIAIGAKKKSRYVEKDEKKELGEFLCKVVEALKAITFAYPNRQGYFI